MIRPLLLLASLLAVVLAAAVVGGPGASHAGGAVRTLTIVAEPPGGAAVELQFLVRAENPEQAYAAAAVAVQSLMPGATIAEDSPGGVSAQFAPWGWKWDDAELPVKVAYNPTGQPASFGPGAVAAMLQVWSSVPSSRFRFELIGLTDAPASLQTGDNDELSVVAWKALDCSQGCVLGVTSKGLAHEADIVLNSNPEARLGDGQNGTIDAQSVLLHEAGHLAGLEHSCPALIGPCSEAERNAVMFYRYQGVKHQLEPDDIAGLQALYPETGAATRPPTAVLGEPVPEASLAVALRPGWNLTVLPAGPIGAATASLPCVSAVYSPAPGGWDVWVAGAHPGLLGLTAAAPGQAYWVLASGSCSYEFR
jgi:hypothetical protein